MKQAVFVIDTFPDYKFSGFSNDEDWNGWACPYFTFEESKKIVEAHAANGIKAWFDETGDEFIFEIEGDEEYYSAINTDGKKLYPIGNGAWIWEERYD